MQRQGTAHGVMMQVRLRWVRWSLQRSKRRKEKKRKEKKERKEENGQIQQIQPKDQENVDSQRHSGRELDHPTGKMRSAGKRKKKKEGGQIFVVNEGKINEGVLLTPWNL